MRDQYVFPGIDKRKTFDDAAKKTKDDKGVSIVHLHSKTDKCQDYMHVMFESGQRTDEWGEIDGSSDPSIVQR